MDTDNHDMPVPVATNSGLSSPGGFSGAASDSQLVELWLRGKSPNTREAYARDVGQFVQFFAGGLHYVRLADIWAWIDELTAQNRSPATIARKIASVKSLFSFGHRVGFFPINVGAAVATPKVPNRLAERILTEAEVSALLTDDKSLRNSALLKLFYASGARVSELAALKWSDAKERRQETGPPQGQITVLGKGAKTRSILLSGSVWIELQTLKAAEQVSGFGRRNDPVLRSSRGGALSRQQIWRIVRDAAKRAGLPQNVSPHWLRHAHASHALDRGAPAHLVKETLGHESLATTSKYTHARPGESSGSYLDV